MEILEHVSIPHMSDIEEKIMDLMDTQYSFKGRSINLSDKGWCFLWDNAKRRFGQCNPRDRIIKISRHLAEANRDDFDDVIKNTVLHEIAHAIHWEFFREANHGFLWIDIARTIGCDGQRYYSRENVKTVEPKYSMICPVCGKEFPIHKKPTRSASCGFCHKGSFDPRFKSVLVQNY